MPLDGVILGHWVSEGGGSHLEGLPGLKEEEVLLEERRAHCFLPVSRGFPACLPEGGLPRGDRLTAAGRQTHSTAVRGVEAAQGLGPGLCGSLAGPEAPASWLRPPHHRDQSPEQQALCPGIAAGPTWVSVSLTSDGQSGCGSLSAVHLHARCSGQAPEQTCPPTRGPGWAPGESLGAFSWDPR